MSNDNTSVGAAVRRLTPRKVSQGYKAPNTGAANPGESVHAPRYRTNNVGYVGDEPILSYSDSSPS